MTQDLYTPPPKKKPEERPPDDKHTQKIRDDIFYIEKDTRDGSILVVAPDHHTPNYKKYETYAPYLYDPKLVWIPSIEYRGGGGISYKNGYESFGTFLALYDPLARNYPFIDVNLLCIGTKIDSDSLHVTSNHFAANVGLGWRMFPFSGKEIFGVNVFLDSRYTKHETFRQIGMGAELLCACWDVRLNGYIPIGHNEALIDTTIFEFPGGFEIIRDRLKAGMRGIDVEIGRCLLNSKCMNIYAAGGPYFYESRCCNTLIGGMGRISVKFLKFLCFQFYVTHDPIFHTNVQGEVRFSFLFPRSVECCKCAFCPVRRNRVIVLEEVCCWDSNF